MVYDYTAFVAHASQFASRFGFADLFSIGESVMERKLYCLKIGRGRIKILITAAENGTEHAASELLMRFLEEYSAAFSANLPFYGKSSAELFGSVSVYALPMLNPDGVDIALHGLDITNPHHRRLISKTGVHSFAKVWRANANGVNLAESFCFGGNPFRQTEPETVALAEFLHTENIDALIEVTARNSNPYYDFSRPLCRGGIAGWFEGEFSRIGRQVEIENDGASFNDFAKRILGVMGEVI